MKKIYIFHSDIANCYFCISEDKNRAISAFFESRKFLNNSTLKYKLLPANTLQNYRTLLRKDLDILLIMDKWINIKNRKNSYFFEKWNIIEKDYKEDFIF